MSKIKKFNPLIRSVSGGKDPVRLVEDFILKIGFDPQDSAKERSPESARWMVTTGEGSDLEILIENMKVPHETTIYLGINTVTVPIRNSFDMLASALQIADGLVGIKVSLVGHFLVLSASLGAQAASVEELDYHFKLICAQQPWFRSTLADEMGWEQLPDE